MSSTIVTVNPATGAELATYQAMTQAEIDSALDAAAAAQRGWAGEDFTVRAEILRAAAALLRERDDELALLVTREMGKPLAEARAEVEKCATGAATSTPSTPTTSWPTRSMSTSADRSWVVLRAGRRGAGGHAVELPALAGVPVRRPGADGRQRRAAQALPEHHRLRAGRARRSSPPPGCPTGCSPRCWSPSRDVPAVTERLIADPRVGAVTITGSERAGSAVGVHRRAGDQEVGARAGRVRPVRRARRRRPAAGRPPGGARPVPQRRAELHLPQAVHRRRGGRRGVHPAGDRRDPRADRRRPRSAGHRRRPDGPARPARRRGRSGPRRGRRRRHRAVRR